MISFSDEQIKLLYQICKNSEQKPEFVSRLDLDMDTAGGGVKFGEILEGDGKSSGLRINGIFKTGESQADLFISLKRHGEGKLYNMRDLRFDIGSILGLLKKFGIEKTRIVLDFKEIQFGMNDGPKYLRNDFTFSELKDAERVASDYNSSIYYSEYLDSKIYSIFKKTNLIDLWLENGILWDLDQVKRANLVVDKLIDAIKKENLSPLQTIAFISAFAFKNFSYSDLKIPINLANVRLKGETQNNIVVAVSCGEIQCVGYDQFFNAITGDLFYHFTNNGDHLISESISIINSEEHEGHAVSVVDLKDKKYSIDDRFLVDINLIRLNVLKRPISDFKPGIYTITKDVDNNIIKSDGTIINSEDFLNQTDQCPLCTNIDGYKYVPSELSGSGKYLAQEVFRPKKKLFGSHYKSFKVLYLSKMSNKDCVKLMSKVYDDIKDVKIPSIEDLVGQQLDKEPNL